jgi:hypothetical protein
MAEIIGTHFSLSFRKRKVILEGEKMKITSIALMSLLGSLTAIAEPRPGSFVVVGYSYLCTNSFEEEQSAKYQAEGAMRNIASTKCGGAQRVVQVTPTTYSPGGKCYGVRWNASAQFACISDPFGEE